MTQIDNGKTVSVEYIGRLQDGSVFDSNVGDAPLQFQMGAGQVIPGFENSVRDMQVGDSKQVTIPPEQAYGERREDLVLTLSKDQFPDDMNPQVGMQIRLQSPQGQPIPAHITAVSGDSVTVDANSRLAGKTLIFEIKLLAVS